MPPTRPARVRLLVVVALTVAVDLLTKAAALRWLGDRTVELGPLQLRVVHNTGVAFSLGEDLPVVLVVAVTGALMAGFALAAWRGHLGGPLTAGLVVGGGVGNLVDRAFRGSVVDVFDVGAWPVFNVADVALTIGIVLLLLAAADDAREGDGAAVEPSYGRG